jgi:hypothetical protein
MNATHFEPAPRRDEHPLYASAFTSLSDLWREVVASRANEVAIYEMVGGRNCASLRAAEARTDLAARAFYGRTGRSTL